MKSQFLHRPNFRKKTDHRGGQGFLPTDLAAAYASYHCNLTEQRRLEWKLHVIDNETKLMKLEYRNQKGILQRELKKSENYFLNCHRVFSAASLVTDSDSYKKDLYIGPKPSKAKLPRKRLERLNRLVRSLQAEEEMEIQSRFERYTRYARRGELLDLVPNLTLREEVSLDSLQPRDLAEIRSEHSARVANSRDELRKVNRIRSAPSRIESRRAALEEHSHESPLGDIVLKSSLKEIPCEATSITKLNESSSTGKCEYKVEKSIRLAWVEKEQEMQKELINSTSNEGVAVQSCARLDDSGVSSREQPQTMQSSIEQSVDFDVPVHVTSSQHRISVGSLGKVLPESSLVNFRPNEAEFEKENVWDAVFFLSDQADRETSSEEECQEEVYLSDSPEAIDTKCEGETTPSAETALIKLSHENGREYLTPTSNESSKIELPLKPATVKKHAWKRGDESQFSNYKHVRFQPRDVKIPDSAQPLLNINVSKTKVVKYDAHDKAQCKKSVKMTKALPKSSLQGLSSHRKPLTPRTQQKPPEFYIPLSDKTQRGERAQDNSNRRSAIGRNLPENITKMEIKIPADEVHRIKNAQKKRKNSISKPKCLSELLYSGQIQVECQLRNRVQGFLSSKEGVDDAGEGTGRETLTHVEIGVDCFDAV